MVRILLADDHAVMRSALRGILATDARYEVCAEAADGEAAVSLAMLHKPDVVILDLSMPRLNGIEATRRIRAALPASEVAIVTMHDSEALMRAAIAAGARAYLIKTEIERHLVSAVEALAAHQSYCVRQNDLFAAGLGFGQVIANCIPNQLDD